MNISKFNLETVARKNLIGNGSKISSVSSEASLPRPINIKKKNSEFSDDSMVCDNDSLDYGDDVDDEDKGEDQSNTAESPPLVVTEEQEIPSKDDRPSSALSAVTFASPERKRTKFPNFDELLQSLNFEILNLNFTKLLLFLESPKSETIFHFTPNEYEEFFKMVLLDINALKSKSLDDCRQICDKILNAATCYILSYTYEYRDDLKKIVMVVRKEPNYTMDLLEEDSALVSWFKDCPEPAMVEKVKKKTKNPSDNISSGFKIHCLRTLLAFIKNVETKSKQFPELTPEQALYMAALLNSDGTCSENEKDQEVRELYRALWEAMQILGLKYEFKIKCVDSWCGQKNVTFKKILKQKPGTDDDSNQTENPKPDTETLDTPMPVGTQACFAKPDETEACFAKPDEIEACFAKPDETEACFAKPGETEACFAKPDETEACFAKPGETEACFAKPDETETCFAKPDETQACLAKPDETETCFAKPDETEACFAKPDVTEACFTKPETPTLPLEPQTTRLTKKMLQHQIKLENEVLFIKRLPAQFVSDTLNSILEFLLDDEKDKLVFLPKNQPELCFHRKVVDWCRTWYSVPNFGEEFEKLHYEISSLLPRFEILATRPRANKRNKITGLKEVVYIKKWHTSKSGSLESVRSTRKKKKKVNLQNALELAGKEQIKLSSVVDLNQSLRHKKKNKKQKKSKSKKANAMHNKVASMGASKSKTWTDDESGSACSSRSTSRDRSNQVAKALVSKRVAKENQIDWRIEANSRRGGETTRKEQLKEAMSVPVQSDKAERMMRGMGWSGGALGARGDGITEPIMPSLDIPRGAGLGHTAQFQPDPTGRNQQEIRTTSSWVSENPNVIEKTENDIIEKQTQELLRENPTVDSVELSKPLKPNVELQKPLKPNVELQKPLELNVELKKSSDQNVEYPKLVFGPLKVNFCRQDFLFSIMEFAQSNELVRTFRYFNKIPMKSTKFIKNFVGIINRRKVNYSIFHFEEFSMYTQIQYLFKERPGTFLEAKFYRDCRIVQIVKIMPDPKLMKPIKPAEPKLPTELEKPTEANKPAEAKKPTELKKPIDPKKPTEPKTPDELKNPTQQILPLQSIMTNTGVITAEFVKGFILSTNSFSNNLKGNSVLKFKVLFLFNILKFVKSQNEESEVNFYKILTLREQSYIQNIIDEVNMRIRFGSTLAESTLCGEIANNIGRAFLGAMFNHKYTVVTLNKYYRFKSANRPVGIKQKCQTNINLDTYKSETVSDTNVSTCPKLTYKENNNKVENEIEFTENEIKFAENCSKFADTNSTVAKHCSEIAENNSTAAKNSNNTLEDCDNAIPESSEDELTNPYDSDESSIEEYCNKNPTATVPSLPPGQEGVDLSSYICLYDEGKPNTSSIKVCSHFNNVTASKVTENINNKNNIGNGNVVIDNNDNEIIDMKKDSDTNTNVRMTEKVMDAIDSEIKHTDVVTANDDGLVKLEEKHARIDEILSNTKDPTDENAIVAANRENISSDDVYVFTGNTSNDSKDTDVIMTEDVIVKENVIEMMEVISITDTEDPKKDTEIKENNCNLTSDTQRVEKETNNLDIKTDCDKGNIVVSGNSCDTQSVAKKVDTDIAVPNFLKNTYSEIKTVLIVHCTHPLGKLSNDSIVEIQRRISKSLVKTLQLPLLKCHGVQNGALIYTCQNEKTYDWLLNTLSFTSRIKVLNAKEVVTKMSLRFGSVFKFEFSYLANMIELYNKLSTKNWEVEKTDWDGDHVILIVKMDKFSIKFIQESGFSLFAGVDKVHFSPVWE